jgi:hypothetical protein
MLEPHYEQLLEKEERKGRNIILAITIGHVFFLTGVFILSIGLRYGFPWNVAAYFFLIFVQFRLYKGRTWAKWVVIVVGYINLLLSLILVILGLIYMPDRTSEAMSILIFLLVAVCFSIYSAYLLMASKSIKEFLYAQDGATAQGFKRSWDILTVLMIVCAVVIFILIPRNITGLIDLKDVEAEQIQQAIINVYPITSIRGSEQRFPEYIRLEISNPVVIQELLDVLAERPVRRPFPELQNPFTAAALNYSPDFQLPSGIYIAFDLDNYRREFIDIIQTNRIRINSQAFQFYGGSLPTMAALSDIIEREAQR